MKKEILITKKVLEATDIAIIVDTVFDQLLPNKLNAKYIKILVKFYDKEGSIMKPYLFLKDKCDVTKYRYHNHLYNKFKYFITKYFTVEIYKYEISIKIS